MSGAQAWEGNRKGHDDWEATRSPGSLWVISETDPVDVNKEFYLLSNSFSGYLIYIPIHRKYMQGGAEVGLQL